MQEDGGRSPRVKDAGEEWRILKHGERAEGAGTPKRAGRTHPRPLRAGGTYAGHSRAELFRLVGMLTLVAHSFSEEHGCLLPMRTGRFIEDPEAGRFMLAPEGPQGAFDKLSVPRGCAFE